MDDDDHISAEEFWALRRLRADEAAFIPDEVVNILRSKRLVRPTEIGWGLTITGRAEHLRQLDRAFNGRR